MGAAAPRLTTLRVVSRGPPIPIAQVATLLAGRALEHLGKVSRARRPNPSHFAPPRAQILAARAACSSQVSQTPSARRANSHDSARPRARSWANRARASPKSPESLRLARGILIFLAPRAPQVRQKRRARVAISGRSGESPPLRGALGSALLLPSGAQLWCLLDRRSSQWGVVSMWGRRRSASRVHGVASC